MKSVPSRQICGAQGTQGDTNTAEETLEEWVWPISPAPSLPGKAFNLPPTTEAQLFPALGSPHLPFFFYSFPLVNSFRYQLIKVLNAHSVAGALCVLEIVIMSSAQWKLSRRQGVSCGGECLGQQGFLSERHRNRADPEVQPK